MKIRYRETIHNALDAGASPSQLRALRDGMHDNPAMLNDLDELLQVLQMTKRSGRVQPPPLFTDSVMSRLSRPHKQPSFMERVAGFFLRRRVLQWNMASALAVVLILLLYYVFILPSVGPGNSGSEAVMSVRLSLYAPDAQSVTVAGTFNKWSTNAHVMIRQTNGVWTIELPLRPGVYDYMFVIDGSKWIADPNAESFHDDGFGQKNSVLRINI